MTNEKGPGNLEFPSPEINITTEHLSSQGGNFASRIRSGVDRVTKHWARIAGAAGIFVSTLVSPIDSPKEDRARKK